MCIPGESRPSFRLSRIMLTSYVAENEQERFPCINYMCIPGESRPSLRLSRIMLTSYVAENKQERFPCINYVHSR